MQIVRDFASVPSSPFVFGIGFFDGFHLGHREIWDEVRRLAVEKDAAPAVITFSPHPAAVLFPDMKIELLQSEEEKEKFFEEEGASLAVILRPTKKFLAESPEDFLRDLASIPGLCGIVCGENFTFGRGAAGKPSMISEFFKTSGVVVRSMPLLTDEEIGGRVISSSEIRRMLREGKVFETAELLGRPYSLSGSVEEGFSRGRTALGFPTANLSFGKDRVLPADGVYAVYANVKGERCPAVTNIGTNPTFGNAERTVETFVLDFDESLYGQPFSVEFIERIRGEIKFGSVSALKTQIERDIEAAREILGNV